MISTTTKTEIIIPRQVREHPSYADWLAFHLDNRHVIRSIISALDIARLEGRRAGIKRIVEDLRWSDESTTGEPFKLDNRLTSLYAHIIYHNFPQYREVFSVKKLS